MLACYGTDDGFWVLTSWGGRRGISQDIAHRAGGPRGEEQAAGHNQVSPFVDASSGADTENRWADLDMIAAPGGQGHRQGHHNEGRFKFFDKHLSVFPGDLL